LEYVEKEASFYGKKNAHGHATVENLSEDVSTREEPDEEVTERRLHNGNSIGNDITNQVGITPSVESWVGAVAVCRGTDLAASGAGNGVVRLWAIENSSKSLRALHDIPLSCDAIKASRVSSY